jgi:hypothetical protein
MIQKFRDFSSRIDRGYLEHVFWSIIAYWIVLIVKVMLGDSFALIALGVYVLMTFLWEILGKSKFDYKDILYGTIPIAPTYVFLFS